MNQPSTSKNKWIILAALTLFCLSGGVYRMSRNGNHGTKLSGTEYDAAKTASTGTQKSTITSPGNSKTPSKAPLAVAQVPAPAQLQTTPSAPAESCMTLTYHHKALASHIDEEFCSHHKNLIHLAHSNANPKSVCVRVNGTPVHFLSVKGHSDELIIGSMAGPKAKVTVKYCVGNQENCTHLHEDCSVPKDEFMSAIGGSQDESADPRLGQWDPSSAKEADVMARLDGDVKKELENNDDLNGRAPKGDGLFKDWIVDNQSSACGAKQASN